MPSFFQLPKFNYDKEIIDLISTYFDVYVQPNLDSLLIAASTAEQRSIVVKLITGASQVSQKDYEAVLNFYYPPSESSEETRSILLFYRRLVSKELTKEDNIIISLIKSHFYPSLPLPDLNLLISTQIIKLTSEYLQKNSPHSSPKHTRNTNTD